MTRDLESLRYDDVLDSRDIEERIEELVTARDSEGLSPEEQDELAILSDFADDGRQMFSDWKYGEGLVRDSYFVEYAQDLAEDIGAIPADASWPAYCIDWNQAARELQMDYSAVELLGVTYWGR